MRKPPWFVLVVEDDEDQRETVVDLLRLEPDLEVVGAEDGAAALRLIGQRRPDAVVLDLRMPGVDGWQLAARLREESATRELPLVGLTALGQDAQEAAKRAGCRAVVAKPFEADLLVAVLRGFLEEEPPRR